MRQDLSNKRRIYSLSEIDFESIPNHPVDLFDEWYKQTRDSKQIIEPYAMTVATIGADGFPRTRVVLLKEYSSDGFVFYTNYNSQKGKAIELHPQLCLSFFWDKLERQVIIKGIAEKLSSEKSDEYFRSRPIESQIGAIVSEQSSVIDFNKDLPAETQKMEEKFKDKEITRPENWGGFLVRPIEIEFWQGRPGRLHDRLRFRLVNNHWLAERLAP